MRRVILAGGSGFIGQAVVNHLINLENFDEIIVIGRQKKFHATISKNVKYYAGDIRDTKFLKKIIHEDDYVVDFCHSTVPGTSFKNPAVEVQDNMLTNIALMQFCSEVNVKKYLYISSGGTVYGNSSIKKQNEKSPTNPISPYGIAKLFTEKFVLFYNKNYGLNGIIARPSNPYGVNQIGNNLQGFIGTAISSLLTNKSIKIFGETGTIRDYIYIDDLACGIINCLEFGQLSEIYNIGTGNGFNNLEILNSIESVFGKKFKEIYFQESRKFDVQRNILDSKKLFLLSNWRPKYDLYSGLSKIKEQLK